MDKNEKPVKLPFSKTLFAIHSLQSVEVPISEELKKGGREFLEGMKINPEKELPEVAQQTREQSGSKSRSSPSQEEQEVASEGLGDAL